MSQHSHHICNGEHPFLPQHKSWDILLSCSDVVDNIESDDDFVYIAFGLKARDLADASSFFKLRIEETARTGGEMCIELIDESSVVVLVLSAAFEPSHELLRQSDEWVDILAALDLARSWQLQSARLPLFHALLRQIATSDEYSRFPSLGTFICEAMFQGPLTLNLARDALELRHKAGLKPIRLDDFKDIECYMDELGPKRSLQVMEMLYGFARDGVLK